MEEFIRILTDQIRCAKARDGVARELSSHILDQAQAYEQSGMAHDKAVTKAVREMGDPVEIGVLMDRIHRPQFNWRMLLVTFVLSVMGILCLIPVYGVERGCRQGLFMLAGFAVIAAVYFVDYSVIGRISAAAYLVMTIVLFIGRYCMTTVNGRIPVMSILVYLYVPVFAGILYQLRMGGCRAVGEAIAVSVITFVLCTYFSSTLPASFNILLIMIIMVFAAIQKGVFGKGRKRMTAIAAAAVFLPSAVFLGYLIVGRAGFRVMRIKAFFQRDQYRDTYNYIYTVIDDILRNARFVGRGGSEMDGMQYATFTGAEGLVPLAAMHVYGFIAGILLVVMIIALVLHAVKIVRGQKNQLGFLVSMGCMLVLLLNCLEGILVNVGLFPATTVVIPFLTYGGGAAFVYAVLIGLLLGVHRYEKVYARETYSCKSRWRVDLKIEKR